jgi:carboxypeptidase Q
MQYDTAVPKIPAAALSTKDANLLAQRLIRNADLMFAMEMDCRTLPDVPSFNVIGELKGRKSPDEFITIGGHLDSWDLGEGAHDDGAGVIHCFGGT